LWQVAEETVADDDMVMIRGSSNTRACTVLLRGANDYMLDEMDRSLHDAFCVVKRVLESGNVVPGLSTCLSFHTEATINLYWLFSPVLNASFSRRKLLQKVMGNKCACVHD
jgi:hypothetical protein